MPEFVTQYNKRNKKVSIDFKEPSLTEQMYKDECDINWIINNFVRTGHIPERQMSFVDCTTVEDYQSAQYILAEAKSCFYDLPSKERDKFKTVDKYLEFISNPDNLRESYEKGYIDPSTVDVKDIYPERYSVKDDSSTSSSDVKQPTEDATTS